MATLTRGTGHFAKQPTGMPRDDPEPRQAELQAVLDVLQDPDCRNILRETDEPKRANELAETVDIPESTLYRKLNRLSSVGLLHEQNTVRTDGGRVSHYVCDFDSITIRAHSTDGFTLRLEGAVDDAEERLAAIWSKMGDEL
ncbi:MAG: helix-turn-helix domain-containing protein [Halolamina sp.]